MDSSPLRTYDVRVGEHTTLMKLNDADAAGYGDAATLAANQPASRPLIEPKEDAKSRLVTSNKMRGTDVQQA